MFFKIYAIYLYNNAIQEFKTYHKSRKLIEHFIQRFHLISYAKNLRNVVNFCENLFLLDHFQLLSPYNYQ